MAGGGGTMEAAAASDGLVRPVGVAEAALMGVAAEAGVVLPGVDTALLQVRPPTV